MKDHYTVQMEGVVLGMNLNNVCDIRYEFMDRWLNKRIDNNMISIIGASFIADKPSIFGTPNEAYIQAEIEWYESRSLYVQELFRIYGKEVKIWDEVATVDGKINSNYGWMIYDHKNGNQYKNALKKLCQEPRSRQATMIYQRPSMHKDWNHGGMMDFTCTNAVTYYLNGNMLDVVVQMRSNDAVFGYNNDFAWQKHVWINLREDINYIREHIGMPKVYLGKMHWQVQNLHVYGRHFDLIEKYYEENK